FPERLGVPRQEIVAAEAAVVAVPVEAVAGGSLAAALGGAGRRGVGLSRGLPVRAHVFWLSGAEPGQPEHGLLVVLHHIAGDGWSLGPLWRDIGRCYAARRRGGAADLPSLPVQYADYTLWQHGALGDESDAQSAIARQLGFWRETLAGLPEQ